LLIKRRSKVSFKTYEKSGKVTVIDCPHRLDANVSDELKNIMMDLIEGKKFKIVINLSDTTYVDSSGLGAIVSRISVTRTNKGDVRLVTQTKAILDLLDLTRLNKILKCYSEVNTAVDSFGKSGKL
jgi:anti-sigma B factor antagonist